MNQSLGIIGRKLGMTQFHTEDGSIARVTAVEAGPCVVVAKRTRERDGYSALQLGFGEVPERLVKLPVRGQYRKVGVEPTRWRLEFRVPEDVAAKFNVGDSITVDKVFKAGDFVDVVGTSKGRGFQGVFRRHHFAGSVDTHGSHEYKRHGGSIGCNMTPGHTFKGVRMPGQQGNRRVTTQNVRVVSIDTASHIILLNGAVPGGRKALVTLRSSLKKGSRTAS
jgi:large subunit ribosomal protein L3